MTVSFKTQYAIMPKIKNALFEAKRGLLLLPCDYPGLPALSCHFCLYPKNSRCGVVQHSGLLIKETIVSSVEMHPRSIGRIYSSAWAHKRAWRGRTTKRVLYGGRSNSSSGSNSRGSCNRQEELRKVKKYFHRRDRRVSGTQPFLPCNAFRKRTQKPSNSVSYYKLKVLHEERTNYKTIFSLKVQHPPKKKRKTKKNTSAQAHKHKNISSGPAPKKIDLLFSKLKRKKTGELHQQQVKTKTNPRCLIPVF